MTPDPTTAPATRPTMAGKPVLTRPAKTVLNLESGFKDKLLCDGPVFSLGDACVYGCTYCFVPAIMAKAAYIPRDFPHHECVIRRENALDILHAQLTIKAKGGGRKPKYDNANDNRIVYSSPLVDIAPNSELMAETVEACALILNLTHWRIRLLTKSSFLPILAAKLSERVGFDKVQARVFFGVSSGTLDDRLAAAIEIGTPLVSKRFASIRKLQDLGYQTFGMICPSLPYHDYLALSEGMHRELRAENMPDVWAEVINVRGESMTRTCEALRAANYGDTAGELERIAADREAWEEYARQTFEAHAQVFGPKLRFLQYATNATRPYWEAQAARGAIVL